ncbi:MAG: hypothetical protein R6V03_02880 [Kiritimatiellia bacterium]
MKKKAMHLDIELDPETGQMMSITDANEKMEVLRFKSGHEVEINGRALKTACLGHGKHWGGILSEFDIQDMQGYEAGVRYRLKRYIVPGGRGNHTGRVKSAHIRYTLRRVPWGDWQDKIQMIWGAPLESPEIVHSVTSFCAPTDFFGSDTRMRAVAIGGSGPREHVSFEEGPVEEVIPWLKTWFRSVFPGQCSVPGAFYYNPSDERWVWVVARHMDVGGRIEYGEDGQRFRCFFHKPMAVHDEIMLPTVSLYYGRGMADADYVTARFFDLYEEPPRWWYDTTWFWLHPMWQPDGTFRDTEKAVDILADECGVNGFGLAVHEIPSAGQDIENRSPKASPLLGGDDGLKRLADKIREKGAHSYVWTCRYGKLAGGTPANWQERWSLRGVDGRALGGHYRYCDSHCPEYQEWILRWVDYYINAIGIDGLFWDSAFQPMVPNFSEDSKAWLNCPGESMTGAISLYERVYRYGRSQSEDFFMWGEGLSTECRMNGFAVDNRTHGDHSGHLLMHRLAHAGPRRLVWRSAWPHDVSGAFPFVSPVNDVNVPPGEDFYRRLAADPMNQWLCRTVKERGCRQARGIADGISVLDEFLVTGASDELVKKPVTVPEELARGENLTHEISGEKVKGKKAKGGVEFHLPGTGAWRMG